MAVRNNDTKVCVMRGFYDESGEYREKHYDDVALFELPEKAQIRINFNYDITVLYSPNEVLVIAHKSHDIEEYKKQSEILSYLSFLHSAVSYPEEYGVLKIQEKEN